MEERYEPLKDLGAGNFGVARLVKDKKTKELLAVKYIERGKKVFFLVQMYIFAYRFRQMKEFVSLCEQNIFSSVEFWINAVFTSKYAFLN